jgi:cysteine-rich repeat protein
MLTRLFPRFAHLGIAFLTSACFAPILPPLDVEGSSTSDTDDPSSGTTSDEGPLDEGSSTGEPAACGNGVLDPGEICDDGINDGTYGGCSQGCMAFAERCGDGVLQGDQGEACDDADQVDGNGCNTDCIVSGTLLWSDIVDGTQSESSDQGGAVAIAPDGTIFTAGTADGTAGTSSSVWLRRYTSDGSALWTELRSVDGDLFSTDLSVLDTGALVVSTLYDAPAGGRFPRLFAYTLEGNPQWGFTHMEPYAHISLASAPGGLIALATDTSQPAWLRRFDAEGTPLWTETPPLMLTQSAITSFPDGGFVVAGTMGSDVWVRRFTAEAEELWTQFLEEHSTLGGITVTADEEIVAVGYGQSYWVEGLDANGGTRWSDSRDEPDGWFFAFDVAPSPDGGVIVVGERKQASDPDLGRLHVARYASSGVLMWEQAHASPFLANGSAHANAVAVDDEGDVVVVGTVSSDTDSDFWILKLAP